MRVPIDESEVERAYAAVGECLGSVEEHFQLCVRLLCNQRDVPPKAPTVSNEGLRELNEGLQRLSKTMERMRPLVKALDRELPGLATEPVRSQSITASSWAEATVMHADVYLRDLEAWAKWGELCPAAQNRLVDAVTRDMPNVPAFRANLKIEEARLRDRVQPLGQPPQVAEVLVGLTKQPRLLMELLTRRSGRWVGYEDISEAIWGERSAPDNRIHQVMARLREELEAKGADQAAREIRGESSAYRYR